jgi:hypothetical protein
VLPPPPAGKKEALANVGGLLCCNDDKLFEQLRNLTIVVEGYPTYVVTCVVYGLAAIVTSREGFRLSSVHVSQSSVACAGCDRAVTVQAMLMLAPCLHKNWYCTVLYVDVLCCVCTVLTADVLCCVVLYTGMEAWRVVTWWPWHVVCWR